MGRLIFVSSSFHAPAVKRPMPGSKKKTASMISATPAPLGKWSIVFCAGKSHFGAHDGNRFVCLCLDLRFSLIRLTIDLEGCIRFRADSTHRLGFWCEGRTSRNYNTWCNDCSNDIFHAFLLVVLFLIKGDEQIQDNLFNGVIFLFLRRNLKDQMSAISFSCLMAELTVGSIGTPVTEYGYYGVAS